MPVFPWRFIDSLLGRSRTDDAEPADAMYLEDAQQRLVSRVAAQAASLEHLPAEMTDLLTVWAREMLRRRSPKVAGWTRRDAEVQLGAVVGAIQTVIRVIDEALSPRDAPDDPALPWRFRAIDAEIAAPLYALEEQPIVRARFDDWVANLERDAASPASRLNQLVGALTPPER